MHVRNHKQRKRFYQMQLYVVSTLLAGFVLIKNVLHGDTPSQELKIVAEYVVPLAEISGLAMMPNDQQEFVLVGDDSASYSRVRVSDQQLVEAKTSDFTSIIYENFSICGPAPSTVCQQEYSFMTNNWEAIAVDSEETLFVLQEHTASVVVLRPNQPSFTKVINLQLNDARQRLSHPFLKMDAKLAEGILLLKNGHIAIAKEGDPSMIVEFAPAGDDLSIGVSSETVLQGEKFQFPAASAKQHYVYHAVAAWGFPGRFKCDLSDMAYSVHDTSVFIVSQKCRYIAELSVLAPSDKHISFKRIFGLPKKVKNPEALAIDKNGNFFVGSDKKKIRKANFFKLKR